MMVLQQTPRSVRQVQRALARAFPGAGALASSAMVLEAASTLMEPARVAAATIVEGSSIRPIRVEGDPVPEFAGFLDGTQETRVVHYLDGYPVLLGTVASVIRARRLRRMVTWGSGPVVERRLYADRSCLGTAQWDSLGALGLPVVDTSDDDGDTEVLHPFASVDRARELVQNHRESLEQRLAAEWCAKRRDALFVDGGLRGDDRLATASCLVGVVKSHRTLYVKGDGLRAVLALPVGFRSNVLKIATGRRSPVLSWYLRLRDPRGQDPMWGLVRVEVAMTDDYAARANEVSRWILAERAPLSVPDGRWDRMMYGVRDVEEFLRAVT